jgi:Domain of unknown function (DUF6089)
MRKFVFLFIFFPLGAIAQRGLYLDISGGFSNYQGDLQESRFTTEQARFAFALGARYNITKAFALRSNIMLAGIAASDKYNKKQVLRERNLNFKSRITEINLLLDYTLFDLNNNRISPYIFAGVAVFHFNPYTLDSTGSKFYLKPLSTEGQGLAAYPGKKNYHLTQLSIPFGGGIRWRLGDNMMLSYEIGLRKTSTDYLDDVSSRYVDQTTLAAERGAKAVELAYRGNEKGGPPYPAEGVIRGGEQYKDWYYVSGITLSIGINSNKGFRGFGGNKGRTGCPKKVL